jgi:hypothetical protein
MKMVVKNLPTKLLSAREIHDNSIMKALFSHTYVSSFVLVRRIFVCCLVMKMVVKNLSMKLLSADFLQSSEGSAPVEP